MLFDLKVRFQEFADREVRHGLPIGNRTAFEQEPAVDVRRPGELVQQTGLANARLPNDRHDLTMAGTGPFQGLAEGRQLRLPPHEARAGRAAACKRVRAAAAPTSSKTSTGAVSPFIGTGPRALTCTNPSTSRSVSAVNRMLPGVASCSMRAARCVVWPIAE